jgi:hypothetical protein
MKYKLTTTRTYVTEMIVVAESESDAWDWVNENSDLVAEAELEQMNVMYDESTLEPCIPSPNEYDELQSLAYNIQRQLQAYRHVEDFIPSEMHEALAKMTEPIVEETTHNVQTNMNGDFKDARAYVNELNELIGRNAFDYRPNAGWLFPNDCDTFIVSGVNISDEEINRLNLRQDFIID